jgi:hypothetical protein
VATITASALGGNWSATGTWVGGVVPTSDSDVLLTVASGNVTVDTGNRYCRSLNCATYVGTLDGSGNLWVGDGTAGHFTLVAGMTYSVSGDVYFQSTTTGNNVTMADKELGTVYFAGVGGEWTLQDSLSVASRLELSAGSLITNNQPISCYYFVANNNAGIAQSLTLGASEIGVGGFFNIHDVGSGDLTFNAGTSSITTYGSITAIGFTLYDVVLQFGFYDVRVTGCHNLTVVGGAYPSFYPGETTTITGDFTTTASAGNEASLSSQDPGVTPFTLSKASGVVDCDYLIIQDSTATGGADWYAGANSTDVSGNSGWIFSDAPSGGGGGGSGINLGTSAINKLKLGATEINRIYLGGTKVFG